MLDKITKALVVSVVVGVLSPIIVRKVNEFIATVG